MHGDKMKFETNNMTGLTYRHNYNNLSLLAKNMFKWINLPDEIDEEFLERMLYEVGFLIFFKDETFGYMVTRATKSGLLNIYERPTYYHTVVTSSLFNNRNIRSKECVVIRNNAIEEPTLPSVRLFASRITNTQMIIDVNITHQKTPLVILCDDKQRLTLQNLYNKYEGNEPAIFGDKSLRDTLDSIKTIDTKAPYVADKLLKYKHDITNEFYTFIGVNNVNADKKERLITNEADANNEQIEFNANTMLATRKTACKKINEMFGLNIDVELVSIGVDSKFENEEQEGDINE